MKAIYIIGLFLVCFSCKEDELPEHEFCDRYEEGKIMVGIKEGIGIKKAFDFINAHHFVIDQIALNSYVTSLPYDSMDYITNYLNSKDYIIHNGFKAVVFFHNQTRRVTISCQLWNMTSDNQKDWLETEAILKLTDQSDLRYLVLLVPVSEEKKWVMTFEGINQIVTWAELDCYGQIRPD